LRNPFQQKQWSDAMPPQIFYNLKKFHIFRIFLIPVLKDKVLHQILLHSSIRIDIHSFAASLDSATILELESFLITIISVWSTEFEWNSHLYIEFQFNLQTIGLRFKWIEFKLKTLANPKRLLSFHACLLGNGLN
jgi:hypothetical protein